MTSSVKNIAGTDIPLVKSDLEYSDYLGAFMVRWGINRNSYKVRAGLYAIGNPDDKSDVFVTANYKLTFDVLRKNLSGISGWILVLDTRGINVWCAAGKGTFGTEELNSRIKSAELEKVVSHRRLIVPQLGATGVAAHKVKKETGFNIHYGPVRAGDIKRFIEAGYRADSEMRRVRFGLWERTKLIPVEITGERKYLLLGLLIISLLSLAGIREFTFNNIISRAGHASLYFLCGYATGVILTPLFLPVLPGRSFALKGSVAGIIVAALIAIFSMDGSPVFEKFAWILMITAISSFLGMNFTGSSTYTSISGVKKEMKVAVPLQIAAFGSGLVLFIIGGVLK